MKGSKITNPKIKLALAIAIPVMVMVVTIAMVGASFAWFSQNATAEISTINLSTREVFTLVFEKSASDTTKYQGETAFAYTKTSNSSSEYERYLINDYRAKGVYGFKAETVDYQYYIQDAPFKFKTTMRLNSDDKYIDMNIAFNTVTITYIDPSTSATSVLASYGNNIPSAHVNYASSDIPLCFTWYMVKTGSSDKIMYTPYGKIEYASHVSGYDYATSLNGVAVTDSTSIESMPTVGMEEFYTDGVETYDIYVVFCPEKLYWMQYFKADMGKSLDDIYTLAEINKIVSEGYPNKIYYSASSFWGSTFSMTATMSVTNVDWTRSVQEELHPGE